MVDAVWVDMSSGLSLDEGPHATRDNENGVLFYLEYILLKEAKGQDITDDVAAFKQIVQNISVPGHPGLYDRGAGESSNPDKDSIRVISHDNMTAIAAFDARYGDGKLANDIVIVGLKNQLRYDNAYPDAPRWKTIQWPTDWAFWALSSSGKWLYAPLIAGWYPLFTMRCVMSMFGQPGDTSGRLLNFVRFASYRDKSLPMKLMWKLFVYLQVREYGDNWLHAIMAIYFHNPNHPLHDLSDNVSF